MEALLGCQVSHTVPGEQPQERRTNVLFQLRHTFQAKKRAHNLKNKQDIFILK